MSHIIWTSSEINSIQNKLLKYLINKILMDSQLNYTNYRFCYRKFFVNKTWNCIYINSTKQFTVHKMFITIWTGSYFNSIPTILLVVNTVQQCLITPDMAQYSTLQNSLLSSYYLTKPELVLGSTLQNNLLSKKCLLKSSVVLRSTLWKSLLIIILFKKCLIKSEMVPCLTIQNSLLSTNYLTQSELVLSSALHTTNVFIVTQNV